MAEHRGPFPPHTDGTEETRPPGVRPRRRLATPVEAYHGDGQRRDRPGNNWKRSTRAGTCWNSKTIRALRREVSVPSYNPTPCEATFVPALSA